MLLMEVLTGMEEGLTLEPRPGPIVHCSAPKPFLPCSVLASSKWGQKGLWMNFVLIVLPLFKAPCCNPDH